MDARDEKDDKMSDQTLEPSATLIGGTFTLSGSVTIRLPRYQRLWRWLQRKPTFDVAAVSTQPIRYDATPEEVQAAIEAADRRVFSNVIVKRKVTRGGVENLFPLLKPRA